MKKTVYILTVIIGMSVYAGNVSLPEERLALPEVQGKHLICVWDETANDWYAAFTKYDHSGQLSFQVPEWGKWYWVGLWDEEAGEFVFKKWVGHFVSE